MPGLPSASAVRRAGLAAVVGAGLALVGLSVDGIASMDGTLRAATQPPPVTHVRNVSFVTRSGDCQHWRSPEHRAQPSASPTT
jgi:hypothetical protein